MKFFKSIFPVLLLYLFISACKKEDDITPVSTTPAIELVSVSSTGVHEGDPLTFKIKYTDGDGDLGENAANANNLFLVDNRINITYEYRVQQLAPSGSNIIIEGHLEVLLKATTILNGSSSQPVTYSIYLKDRAGHQSNVVTTPAITITK